jgi:nucleoside-diphosphate-sugar epimerase
MNHILFMNRIAQTDIDHILRHTNGLWEDLRNGRLFITGGTGFFGKWLLETFLAANRKFALNASIVVLSRNPPIFAGKAPHLAHDPAVTMIEGDVRAFTLPEGNFTHVIHGAVDASLKLIQEQPLLIFDTLIQGARRVLDFSAARGVKKTLMISSGAVYGRQPPAISRLTEEYRGAPDFSDHYAVYAGALRAVEALCPPYCAHSDMRIKIARGFAFVGPHLPLDMHFAVGNFILNALSGGEIRVESDGTPRRSYLYAADLAIWLWTILLRGANLRAYNVGSENARSLAEIAALVAQCSGISPQIVVARTPDHSKPPDIYVPSTNRAQTELNLKETIMLPEAIQRTIEFYRPFFKK